MKRQVVSSRTADFFRRHGQRLHVPLMLTVASLIIGSVTGAVCALFELLPNLLNGARTEWLQSLLNSEADCVTVAVLAFVISFVMIVPAIYLTRKYAPEAGGSGIPEIEGAMVDLRPVRYKRVLPIKFFGGILSLSSGMVLGREGPSIQIGGNLGAAVCDFLKIRKEDFYVLLAAGAASGLASAFNAPLAGMLFVLEEMRPQFKYRFSAVQAVAMAVILSTTVRALIVGNGDPVFDLPVFARVDAKDFIDFLIFGCIVGVAGVLFNRAVGRMQDAYASFFRGKILRTVLTVSVVGGIYGAVSVFFPDVTGSGMHFISGWIMTSSSLGLLAAVLLARFIGILLCFCSGIPGGIFAPSLSVGALIGAVLGMGMLHLGILNYDPGILAIVGMSAFFAASVRAPITGIILICEMTNNFQFLLPTMIAVAAATQTASLLKGRPLYTQILERTLRLSGNEEKIEEYRVFKKENNVD